MKNRENLMSMRTKILMLCTISILLALSIQALLFQYTSSNLVYNQAKEASLKSLQNMQDDIYVFIKGIENKIIDIYNRKDLIHDLSESMDYKAMKLKYAQLATDMGNYIFDPSQGVKALYIYDIQNRLISFYCHAATPRYTYPEDIYENPEVNNAYVVKEYVDSDNMIMMISNYYNENSKENIIRFVLKIYANNSMRKIGYVICDIDEKGFKKIIEKYVYSKEQIVWLQPIGAQTVILVGTLTESNKNYYDDATSLIYNNIWQSEHNIISKDNVFFEVPQEKYNLDAFSLTPLFLLKESQRELTRNLIIIAMLISIIFLSISVMLTESLTNPLKYMIDTMMEIKKGNTSLRMTNLKNDEIGKLGEAFNDMLNQIESLIAKEYHLKLQANHAEYKALQAQVNPHFLYNTLDTMSSIAAAQQCSSVSGLCKALSNIFRYSIDMKEPLSTIEKEIMHIKNYMYVMNVRMKDSIELDIDVDSELLKEEVPRISIQPLVENSILHGLKDKEGTKKIIIKITTEDNDIVISVIDNGVGMDADKINQQLRHMKLENLEEGQSIGLNNINSRVKLLYGEKYGIRVWSERGKGSTVHLHIPRKGEYLLSTS